MLKHIHTYSIIFFICILPFSGFAQSEQHNDTHNSNLSAAALNQLALDYMDTAAHKALSYAKDALVVAEKNKNPEQKANALKHISYAYFHIFNYGKSIEYAQKALSLFQDLNNKKQTGKMYILMGAIHKNTENYEKSLDLTRYGLEIYQEINYKDGIAAAQNNLGIAYKAIGKTEKALLYYKESLSIKEELNDKRGMANTMNNMALVFTEIGDTKALTYHTKALRIRKEINDLYGISSSYANVGDYYNYEKKYNLALSYLDSAQHIALLHQYKDIRQRIYFTYYEIYSALKDYKSALSYYREYNILKDSILNDWTKAKMAELEIKYEVENKEKENEILRQQTKIRELELARQRSIRNKLSWLLLLVGVFIVIMILYYRNRMKQKANVRLKQLNEVLEQLVAERTEDLQNEVDVRTKTEKALRKSEEEFRTLFEKSPDAIFVEDENGIILDVNPAACMLHSMDRKDMISTDISTLIPVDRRESFRKDFRKWFAGEVENIESKIVGKDGNIVPVEIRASRIEYKSLPALLLHVRDITERTIMENQLRNSESKYRSLFSEANDSIFLLDKDKFIDCNNKTLEVFGCRKNDIINAHPTQFSPEYQPDGQISSTRANYYINKALEGKPQRFYWKHSRLDGSTFDAEVSLNLFDSGDKHMIQAIVRDITEQKQTEEALRKAKQEAEETTRLKSLFLANVSHEIRTPMYGIVGMTDLLRKTDLNEEQKEYLYSFNDSANSLLGIVNDILDLSKIEAGQFELESIGFDLKELITDISKLLNYKAKNKNIALLTDIAEQTPLELLGDPLRIKQVLINLVDNAIKFTEKGSVTIRVTPLKIHRGKSEVKLKFEIIDTGIGISKTEQNKLFKSFSQTDASTTRKYGGTGLGLAISKNLAEMMGGEIALHSKVGEGSTFWFTALFFVDDEAYERKKSKEFEGSEEHIAEKPLKILVAEDNVINQKVISASLKRLGHDINIANNGAIAIEMFKNNSYDLILMDVQMPEMDGIEATKIIRKYENSKNVKNPIMIIALTANAMKEDKEKCLGAGMNYYLSKPFKQGDLERLLSN